MNTSAGQIIFWLIVIVLVLAGGWYFLYYDPNAGATPPTSTTTATSTGAGNTTSDGTITFSRPDDFGLAVRPEQILVESTVPPCDDGFDYCLYYAGDAYADTNLESAGLSITERTDATTERLCLDTPPEGFDASMTPDDTNSQNAYSTSVFSAIGDSGAGHAVQGSAYRLYVRDDSSCYDFTTRIASVQLDNMATSTVDEFTEADRGTLNAKIEAILRGISLNGAVVVFPTP